MRFVPVGDPLIEDFLVGAHEVRKRDFNAFINATGATPAPPKPKFQQGGAHPVVNVTRSDAEEFCRWLTNHEREIGRIGAGDTYRLPTDAEWSTAAGAALERGDSPADRGGRTFGVYPWGVQWPPPAKVGNYADKTYRMSLGRSNAEASKGLQRWRRLHGTDRKVQREHLQNFRCSRVTSGSGSATVTEELTWGCCRPRSDPRGKLARLRERRPRSWQAPVDVSPETRAENIGFRVVLSRGTTPVETRCPVNL